MWPTADRHFSLAELQEMDTEDRLRRLERRDLEMFRSVKRLEKAAWIAVVVLSAQLVNDGAADWLMTVLGALG